MKRASACLFTSLIPLICYEYRHNNVLVIGPNGGGKSSLFRILAGIMPGLGYINNRNALITPITGEISQQESKENSCICYTHTPPGTDSIGTQPCSFIHPPSVPVLFLPQRAYLTNGGSLRSQVCVSCMHVYAHRLSNVLSNSHPILDIVPSGFNPVWAGSAQLGSIV